MTERLIWRSRANLRLEKALSFRDSRVRFFGTVQVQLLDPRHSSRARGGSFLSFVSSIRRGHRMSVLRCHLGHFHYYYFLGQKTRLYVVSSQIRPGDTSTCTALEIRHILHIRGGIPTRVCRTGGAGQCCKFLVAADPSDFVLSLSLSLEREERGFPL